MWRVAPYGMAPREASAVKKRAEDAAKKKAQEEEVAKKKQAEEDAAKKKAEAEEDAAKKKAIGKKVKAYLDLQWHLKVADEEGPQ